MCVCVHRHVCMCACVCVHACTFVYLNACVRDFVYVGVHACVCMHVCACEHIKCIPTYKFHSTHNQCLVCIVHHKYNILITVLLLMHRQFLPLPTCMCVGVPMEQSYFTCLNLMLLNSKL